MISQHLRVKILGGALLLVLMVSLFSTVVVSFIVSRQNKAAVTADLEKGLTIVRDNLIEIQQNIVSDLEQMAEINKTGEQIKFIMEFGDKGVSIAKSSFVEIANAAFERAVSGGYKQLLVYTLDGTLVGFARQTPQAGFLKSYLQKDKFTFKLLDSAVDSDDTQWEEKIEPGNEFPEPRFTDAIPSRTIVRFAATDDQLRVQVAIPITSKVFNDATDAYESKQNGFAVADKILDQNLVAKISRLTGLETQIFSGQSLFVGKIDAYKTLSMGEVEKKRSQNIPLPEQAFLYNTIDIEKQGYFQGTLPIYEGQAFVGAVALLESDQTVAANTRQMVLMLSLVALACMILSVPMAFLVSGKMVRPISEIVQRLKDIAEGEGDLTKRLAVKSQDEIGQVARWFNVFIDKIHEMIKNVSRNAEQLHLTSSDLADISKAMDSGSDQTATKTNVVAAAINQMSATLSSVASAMNEASDNVNMVATSTEQMSTTINEISRNAVRAREVTMDAVAQSQAASEQVGELGGAANDIGNVIEAITEISEQVNLLSLNATIEAARAGEAGKGFAVVANEIKELANQTAAATNDIKEKVVSIRNTTDKTVLQINSISNVVNDVNEIVVIITSAVEEQSATTHNISENVGQVSQGIEAVNQNVNQSSEASQKIAQEISEVSVTADEMSRNGAKIKERSVGLSQLSDELGQMVGSFKI